MMTTLEKLKAAGARVDGLGWDRDGTLTFLPTNASGSWTAAQEAKVRQVLGRRRAVS